jgi:uncharacterized protein
MQRAFRQPLIVLGVLAVCAALAFYFSSRLRFDYDFEKFFPDDDPALPFFQEHRRTFGFDNEFILVALENREGIFKKDFLEKVRQATDGLKGLPLVDQVSSPTNLKKASVQELGFLQVPLLHYADPGLYADDSSYIYNSRQWRNTFFAADAHSVCIYVQSVQGISKAKSDTLAAQIKRCVGAFGFDGVHFAGRIFAQAVYLDKLKEQFMLFLLTSFFLISALLWFTFKKIKAVLLPLSLVFLSLLLTFGIMGALGNTIDIMAVMIPSMVFVAGMSDVVHFYAKYADETRRRRSQPEIFRLIYKEVAGPTFLTLLSTVAGFLSLCYSGVKPIRDFGIYTSVGITIAFILTYTYLPAVLMLFPGRDNGPERSRGSATDLRMQRLFGWVIRNGRLVSVVTLLVLLFSAYGMTRLQTNQSILEDLPKSEKVKQDLYFFERHYGGVRPLELAVEVKAAGKDIWDYDVIQQIDRVEEFVAATYSPGFLVSPASTLRAVNQAYDDTYVIPTDTADFRRDVSLLRKNRRSRQLRGIVTADGRRGRFTAKMRDAGSRELAKLNGALLDFIRTHTDSSTLKFTITGTANLIDINNQNLITNTLQGLLTGVGLLALLTLALHRSLKMMLVFLVPNLVPLVIMAGFMGLFGIELKSSTAIFFSIAFGIATDDTIHFISRFRLEMRAGYSPLRAFRQTYFETGKAVFLTTLILLGGFVSLITSDFQSIYLFGLLTAITLVVALLSEIFLLPVLLTSMFRKKK